MLKRSLCRLGVSALQFDVCVIGGGPAGIAAALRAEQFGKRVCLVEKDRIGGADLWDGALQSKTMWEMAKFYDRIRSFGPSMYKRECLKDLQVDEMRMQKALDDVARTRQAQVVEAFRESGVTVLPGTGEFQSPNLIHVHPPLEIGKAPAAAQPVNADYFIIATGSTPRVHPTYSADGKLIMTSDHIMKAPLPKSMVIIAAPTTVLPTSGAPATTSAAPDTTTAAPTDVPTPADNKTPASAIIMLVSMIIIGVAAVVILVVAHKRSAAANNAQAYNPMGP